MIPENMKTLCRGCMSVRLELFIDLGFTPIANDLIRSESQDETETSYKLCPMVCMDCSLVQLPNSIPATDLFRADYVYHSSYSHSWIRHCEEFVEFILNYIDIDREDLIVEVASNDGYLLEIFNKRSLKTLGFEPALEVAMLAREKGIETIIDFFGERVAREQASKQKARLIVGNNVLAHVPDLLDFLSGVSHLLHDDGVASFEFPQLKELIRNAQFDTIYHEHFSYLSLTSLMPIFQQLKLKVIDVQELKTHGGSIRVLIAKENSEWRINESVSTILEEEKEFDPRVQSIRENLAKRVRQIKWDLMSELANLKKAGVRVAAYGAAAKGNTLLNFSGIRSDLIDYVVDSNSQKQGRLLPGSRIPVVGKEELKLRTPDVLLVLPWNIIHEIKKVLSDNGLDNIKVLRCIPKLEYV